MFHLYVTIALDFGNLWEMFSAIGTVCAAAIAVYLAWDERRIKLSAVLLCDWANDYLPTVLLSNSSRQQIIVRRVNLKYLGKTYQGFDLLSDSNHAHLTIVPPDGSASLKISFPASLFDAIVLEEHNHVNGIYFDKLYRKKRHITHRFTIQVTDIRNKKYRSSQPFTKEQLSVILHCEPLCEGFREGDNP